MASGSQVTTPLLRLRGSLDYGVSGQKKASHVFGEEKPVCDAAKNAERRLKVEQIAHNGDLTSLREEMIMIETPEGAAHIESRK